MEPTLVSLVFNGVPLDVSGYYTPGEPMRMYYPDGSGHPGSPAEFEIIAVRIEGEDIIELLVDSKLEELEETIIERLENE